MENLFITVGRAKKGRPLALTLYLGADADKAIAALNAAAQKGEIVYGEIYRNPAPWRKEDFYHLSEAAKQEAEAARAADAERRRKAAGESLKRRRHEVREAVSAARAAAEFAGEAFDLEKFLIDSGLKKAAAPVAPADAVRAAIAAAQAAATEAGEEFDLQKFLTTINATASEKPADGEIQTSPSAGESPVTDGEKAADSEKPAEGDTAANPPPKAAKLPRR